MYMYIYTYTKCAYSALRLSSWGIEVYEDVTSSRNKEIGLLVGRTTSAKIVRAWLVS